KPEPVTVTPTMVVSPPTAVRTPDTGTIATPKNRRIATPRNPRRWLIRGGGLVAIGVVASVLLWGTLRRPGAAIPQTDVAERPAGSPQVASSQPAAAPPITVVEANPPALADQSSADLRRQAQD